MFSRPHIRVVLPESSAEILLIAERMLATLVEVLGEERARSMYTLDGAVQKVMWHLKSAEVVGEVFVVETAEGVIVGHTIVRVDEDEEGQEIGLFGTTYVIPAARNAGLAASLLKRGEQWMLAQGMNQAVTYTDEHNIKLQNLYRDQGYTMSEMPKQFVKLAKSLRNENG